MRKGGREKKKKEVEKERKKEKGRRIKGRLQEWKRIRMEEEGEMKI